MSAPNTEETWQQPPVDTFDEPTGNVHSGKLVLPGTQPTVVPETVEAQAETEKDPWPLVVATAALVIVTLATGFIASVAQYQATASYSYDEPTADRQKPQPYEAPSVSAPCEAGYVLDEMDVCTKVEAYRAAEAKAEKKFSARLKDGKADAAQWATRQGLAPALKSARDVVLTAYLCSAKPSEHGRLYAANTLDPDGEHWVLHNVVVDDVGVAIQGVYPEGVARDICPSTPNWAQINKPKPPSASGQDDTRVEAPQPTPPPPSVSVEEKRVVPPPDYVGYGG